MEIGDCGKWGLGMKSKSELVKEKIGIVDCRKWESVKEKMGHSDKDKTGIGDCRETGNY